MGPAVPVLSPAAHGNRSPEEAGAELLRHDWAQSDRSVGTEAPGAAHTPEQEWHRGTPPPPTLHRQQRCPGVGVTTGDAPACLVCLPFLPAGVLRAPTLSRSCGRGTPAHTEESGLASRADGEPGGGLPPPCSPPSPAGSAGGVTRGHTPRSPVLYRGRRRGHLTLHPGKPRRSAPLRPPPAPLPGASGTAAAGPAAPRPEGNRRAGGVGR